LIATVDIGFDDIAEDVIARRRRNVLTAGNVFVAPDLRDIAARRVGLAERGVVIWRICRTGTSVVILQGVQLTCGETLTR